MDIGMKKTLPLSWEAALEAVPVALKAEGFGVLTKIDVQATLKEKLGVDFRRYTILARATRASPTARCRSGSTWGCCCPATWCCMRPMTARACS